MVFKGDGGSRIHGDAGVLEDHGPLGRIIDAFADVGGVVLIPGAGHGLGEVDLSIGGDDQGAISAVGTWDDDVGLEHRGGGHQAEAGEEVSGFHKMKQLRRVNEKDQASAVTTEIEDDSYKEKSASRHFSENCPERSVPNRHESPPFSPDCFCRYDWFSSHLALCLTELDAPGRQRRRGAHGWKHDA